MNRISSARFQLAAIAQGEK